MGETTTKAAPSRRARGDRIAGRERQKRQGESALQHIVGALLSVLKNRRRRSREVAVARVAPVRRCTAATNQTCASFQKHHAQ